MVARFLANLLHLLRLEQESSIVTVDTIDELPNGTEEFYLDRFQKRIFPHGWKNVQHNVSWMVLHYVVAAKEPLTFGMIQELSTIDGPELRQAIEQLCKLALGCVSEVLSHKT